jgi:hypothetical protein
MDRELERDLDMNSGSESRNAVRSASRTSGRTTPRMPRVRIAVMCSVEPMPYGTEVIVRFGIEQWLVATLVGERTCDHHVRA